MEIDEIKNIWTGQKAADTRVKSSGYYTSLLDEIQKNEKKTKRNYLLMSLVMLLTIFFIDRTAVESIPDKTPVTWGGFILIYLAIGGIVFVSWASVIKFKINGITESSLDFLKKAREKLMLRNKIRTIGMPLYIGLLTLGISLTYIQITSRMQAHYRVMTYAGLYIFIITITTIAMKKEKKKYLKHVKPIEDKIDALITE